MAYFPLRVLFVSGSKCCLITAKLDGHNLFFLLLKRRIYHLAVLLEQLLSLALAILALILRHTLLNGLLECLYSITTSIAQ